MMRLFSSLRDPTFSDAGAYCTFCFFSPRITSQFLSLESGRRSSILTVSPIEYVLASSCAWYFFERRRVFFMVGCVKRRSTRTTTVLSCLSLTTTPCSVRFGISSTLISCPRRAPTPAACERQRFLGGRLRNAIDLEQDAAGLDAHDPKLGRALAFAHAHFDRLLRHRHVGEHADPDAAGALHEAGERAARRFDLTRGDAIRLQRLQAVLAKGQRRAGRRRAVNAALEGLAVLCALRLQHCLLTYSSAQAGSRRGRPWSPSAIFLSCAIGSCSRISPLKIQTLTPHVPYVVKAVATP